LIQIELARFSEYFEKVLSNELKSNKKIKADFNFLDFLSLTAVTLSEPLALQARLLRIAV
jgi:hypothetical protein